HKTGCSRSSAEITAALAIRAYRPAAVSQLELCGPGMAGLPVLAERTEGGRAHRPPGTDQFRYCTSGNGCAQWHQGGLESGVLLLARPARVRADDRGVPAPRRQAACVRNGRRRLSLREMAEPKRAASRRDTHVVADEVQALHRYGRWLDKVPATFAGASRGEPGKRHVNRQSGQPLHTRTTRRGRRDRWRTAGSE